MAAPISPMAAAQANAFSGLGLLATAVVVLDGSSTNVHAAAVYMTTTGVVTTVVPAQ